MWGDSCVSTTIDLDVRHEVYRSVILLHRLPFVQIGMQRDFPAHCKTQSHGKESTPSSYFPSSAAASNLIRSHVPYNPFVFERPTPGPSKPLTA